MLGDADSTRVDAGHPDRWKVLVVCCTGLFLLVASLTSLNVALPDLQADLAVSTSGLQWVIDSYAVVFGGLLLTGGSLGDRIGRRPSLAGGFLLVALGGLVGGLAGSLEAVIGARVITGLGGALLLPATLSTLTDVFGDDERPRAIAMWSGIAGAAGAFGPAIGGWLIELGSWNAVFWMNTLIAMLGVVAVAAYVPHLPGRRGGAIDVLGAVLSTSAIGLVLFAIIEGPSHPTSPVVIGAGVAGVAAAAAFVAHERRTPAPMLPLQIFDSRTRCSGLITLLFAAVGFAGVLFVAALMLQIGWGASAIVTGMLLVPIGAAELLASFRAASWSARFGSHRVIACGLVLMFVGYAGMALTPTGDRFLFVLAGVIAGLGNGFTIAPSVERVVGNTEPELAGVVAGANETSIELGASLGVAVLGGLQRIAFDRKLPDGADADSVDSALEFVDSAVVFDAYLDASRLALLAGAITVLFALPVAVRR